MCQRQLAHAALAHGCCLTGAKRSQTGPACEIEIQCSRGAENREIENQSCPADIWKAGCLRRTNRPGDPVPGLMLRVQGLGLRV